MHKNIQDLVKIDALMLINLTICAKKLIVSDLFSFLSKHTFLYSIVGTLLDMHHMQVDSAAHISPVA